MYWLLFLKWIRFEILICKMYLSEKFLQFASLIDSRYWVFDDLNSLLMWMLTVFFAELCFSSWISVLRYCIKWKMSEAFILNLSPRSPDYKSGERTECVVAVDLNLIRLPVDLATKWLACARKLKRKTNSNTQACEIHPFYANASLRDSCDIIFSCNLTWNSLVRQWFFL